MEDFNIGDKVVELDSGRKGRIVEIVSSSRRGVLYNVLFVGASQEEQIMDIYLEKDFDISNPFARCKQHIFSNYSEFARKNTSFKIENTSNSTISSLKASKTIFKPYQYKPLLKFISSDNRRLLVADEVGLGKTIEAGHIMLEMKARRELKNVLIVCPKALRQKWQDELQDKFSLSFTIYESTKAFISDLKMKDGAFRGILTYNRIGLDKNDESMQDESKLLGFINQQGKTFSLVLCDEAHRLRNHPTQAYKGMEFIMSRAKAAVFLTATPIMLGNENLFNLLHLLDEQTYDNKYDFQNSLNLNQPFMEALRQLKANKNLKSIADELSEARVTTYYTYNDQTYPTEHVIKEYYSYDPLYKQIIECLTTKPDSTETRARLQYDLTSMSEMNSIFSRTRKREVTKDWSQAERHPFPYLIDLTSEEREVYDNIINTYIEDNSYVDEWGDVKMDRGAAMGLVTKKRQVASSVYAYLNNEDDLDKGIDAYARYEDAKFNTLVSIMNEIFKRGEQKIIVFGLFRKTLKYLNIRLNGKGYKCAVIHGGISDRETVLKEFKTNSDCKVLLSSEVGSEGLDMQFCCSMVNYDLPWNPMVVEQRIGRIDRFGQQSPVVKIYNLIVNNSIQQEIYDRLLDRIGIFRSSIGDLEAILQSDFGKAGMTIQKAYTSLEEDLFCNKRSHEECMRKVDEIAQAVANEKEELKRIEESETNTLTFDSYFQHEINRILHNNSYLTDVELINYVNMIFTEALPTCRLEKYDDNLYKISLPKSNQKCLVRFLDQYHPMGDEMNIQLRKFKNQISDLTEFIVTFSQENAYDDKTLIYINMYHPIIQAALNYFKKKEEANNTTFSFELSHSVLPESISKGLYYLGVYRIVEKHLVYGVEKETYTMMPIVYDVSRESSIIEDDACQFLGKAQVCGKYTYFEESEFPSDEVIDDMSVSMSSLASVFVKIKKSELDVRIKSRIRQKLLQLEERVQLSIKKYRNMVEMEQEEYAMALSRNDKTEISRLSKTLNMHEGKLRGMENNYDEQKEKLSKDPELSVRYEMVSLNMVKVV